MFLEENTEDYKNKFLIYTLNFGIQKYLGNYQRSLYNFKAAVNRIFSTSIKTDYDYI